MQGQIVVFIFNVIDLSTAKLCIRLFSPMPNDIQYCLKKNEWTIVTPVKPNWFKSELIKLINVKYPLH